ncbi:hypothetical protein PCNPT3_07635 [Psychromonas sp. CNPT3]|uniref:hypothetical protein n=1 Tax=Psychromonas sp. CNPT3 TaxID=314282 RepID=UPI00006E70E8|nr:hypothetical protein [Psychromonas sp. CNPT3]AGH81465.1 hypothetical protein PCNPT3_07635 [Psychromonas sp. CNPT3]
MNKFISIVFISCICLSAQASIISVSQGSFVGAHSESFESFTNQTHYTSESILGGNATMSSGNNTHSGNYLISDSANWNIYGTTTSWVGAIPQDGNQFAVLFGLGFINIDFGFNANSFGGYFADSYLFFDTRFDFFDSSNNLLQSFSMDLQSAAGELNWVGFMSDSYFSSVKITGVEVVMDALKAGSVTTVPAPMTWLFLVLALAGLGFSKVKKQF